MKDHEIAALVNALRDIAIKYHGSQQLREQIAAVVVPALRGARNATNTESQVTALKAYRDEMRDACSHFQDTSDVEERLTAILESVSPHPPRTLPDDECEAIGSVTLEAEKAERERQEPVAWAWDDALGCMHVHCGSRRPVWVDGECSDATRAEMKLRPLYARPLPARSDRDCAHYTFVGWLGPRGIFMEDEIYQAWKEHRKDPSAAQYRKVFAAEGDIQ